MIQMHYIYCVLYFYYYYISSTSHHQALDTGGWDPGSKGQGGVIQVCLRESERGREEKYIGVSGKCVLGAENVQRL